MWSKFGLEKGAAAARMSPASASVRVGGEERHAPHTEAGVDRHLAEAAEFQSISEPEVIVNYRITEYSNTWMPQEKPVTLGISLPIPCRAGPIGIPGCAGASDVRW